jgi:hypothetical protein
MVKHMHSDGAGMLLDFLNGYTVPVLKTLAILVAANAPTRKTELVHLIHAHLMSVEGLRAVWQSLDEFQQSAVAETLYAASGRYDAQLFRAKYGGEPDWGEANRWGGRTRYTPIGLLIYNGVIPLDLQEPLKALVTRPRPAEIESSDQLPDIMTHHAHERQPLRAERSREPLKQREMERAAQSDLKAVLRLIDTTRISASDKSKQVTAAGARAIAAVLEGGDFYPLEDKPDEPWDTNPGPVRAFAWPLLLQSGGLVELAGTRLQLTTAGKKALASHSHETIHRLWGRWIKSGLLDEFNRVHSIKGQTGRGRRELTSPAERRASIVRTLQACPPNRWIVFDEFSRYMRARGETFQVARDLWKLYIEDAQYGSLGYSGFGEWHIIQDRYLLAFLFEYVATLGLIDVAYSPPHGARPDFHDLWGTDDMDCLSSYDGLVAFRLNPLGAWCLDLVPTYKPTAMAGRAILKVLPNHEIVNTEPIPAGDVLLLQQFAEQRSDAVWRIDRSKLLDSVERGQSVAEFVAFLETRAGQPLPSNVAVFFNEVAERVLKVVDRGPARLVEVQDTALAHLIANHARLRSLCMLAGERHLVVPAASERAFRSALHDLGYVLAS